MSKQSAPYAESPCGCSTAIEFLALFATQLLPKVAPSYQLSCFGCSTKSAHVLSKPDIVLAWVQLNCLLVALMVFGSIRILIKVCYYVPSVVSSFCCSQHRCRAEVQRESPTVRFNLCLCMIQNVDVWITTSGFVFDLWFSVLIIFDRLMINNLVPFWFFVFYPHLHLEWFRHWVNFAKLARLWFKVLRNPGMWHL